MESLEVGDLPGKPSLFIDRNDHRQPGTLQEPMVVFAETGGDMDDPGTIRGVNEVTDVDGERSLLFEFREVREQRVVSTPLEVFPGEAFDDLVRVTLPEIMLQPAFGENAAGFAVFHLHVGDIRANRKGKVARERPRRCRPRQNGGPRFIDKFEPDGDRRIVHVVVPAEVDLEVGQRSSKSRAVRQDIVPFVDQPLFPEALEDPPNRLHVLRLHRSVVVVEIDPAPHPRDDSPPLAGVSGEQYRDRRR